MMRKVGVGIPAFDGKERNQQGKWGKVVMSIIFPSALNRKAHRVKYINPEKGLASPSGCGEWLP